MIDQSRSSLPLPTLSDDITELAEWYAANLEEIRAWDSALWHAKRRLMEVVKDTGPIVTSAGRLGVEPTGYEYDDEAAAAVMPALVVGMKATIEGQKEDIEEILNTVVDMPGVTYDVAHKIDRKEMLRVIRLRGEAAAKLDECRVPKGRLGVS